MSAYVECPCGVSRDVCDYHRPEPVPDAGPLKIPYMGGNFVFYSAPQPQLPWHITPAPAQAPAKPKPQPTPFGDGTNALDEVCVCGGYIMRPGKVYRAADNSMHGTRACLDKAGNWHSPPPKP